MEEVFSKYIVIGAGPAGLQMGYFLQSRLRDYVILDKDKVAGSFFATLPVHRTLLSINKKYNYFTEEEFNWRHDWNSLLSNDPKSRFTNYTDDLYPHADALHQYLKDFSRDHNLKIHFETRITKISRNRDREFCLITSQGKKYRCKVLLLGLGAVAASIPEDIEGIELSTGYEEQSLDLEQYKNKRVCIIGQGNSAFETAEHLSGVTCYVHVFAKDTIKFAWETHFVGDVRAVNNNVFDMYQLKSMHAVLSPRLLKIERLANGTLQTSHEYDYPDARPPGTLKLTREYDHIIRCTGWNYVDATLFEDNLSPDTCALGKYPALDHRWQSRNIDNLYFIGTTMRASDSKSASGFIHGFRYNIRTLFHLLEEEHEGVSYPSEQLSPFDLDPFLEWMYIRFSTSSALFQLFGYLCDVLVFSHDLSSATLYQELPLEYISEYLPEDQPILIFTLEFGFDKFEESSITFTGPSDPVDGDCAAFLHPVIRYRHGEQKDEFHFGDSLLARWDRPHGKGGAVSSNHYAFLKWLEINLDTDFDIKKPEAGGAYHRWSKKEKEMWERNQMPTEPSFVCTKPKLTAGKS